MQRWQQAMIRLAGSDRLRSWGERAPGARPAAARFVGGDSAAAAVAAARRLRAEHGITASLFYLGEYLDDPALIERTVAETESAAKLLGAEGLGGWCRTGVYGAGAIASGGRERVQRVLVICQSWGWQWVSGLLQPVGDGRQCHMGLSSALGVPRWVNWGPLPIRTRLPG